MLANSKRNHRAIATAAILAPGLEVGGSRAAAERKNLQTGSLERLTIRSCRHRLDDFAATRLPRRDYPGTHASESARPFPGTAVARRLHEDGIDCDTRDAIDYKKSGGRMVFWGWNDRRPSTSFGKGPLAGDQEQVPAAALTAHA